MLQIIVISNWIAITFAIATIVIVIILYQVSKINEVLLIERWQS